MWNMPTPVPATTLQAALDWLDSNVMEGGVYTITVNADETIAPKTLSYSGKTVSVTLDGGSAERTVSLSTTGSLFTIGSGVTLTLGNNITLQGRSDNTALLARVDSGTLVMENGSKISGNSFSSLSSGGGGVYVSNGTFTMNGGEISDNSASYHFSGGGGVYVSNNGTFTMSDGTISGNTASSYQGGGVYVDGAFIMSGGEISGNTASYNGGGVYVSNGRFTLSGGAISGNIASYGSGGGVYVDGSGTFTKQSDGTIYGSNADSALINTATNGGHAVYVESGSKKRDTTAGADVTLNSGSAGGWE